ncbi:hypothetical protein LTR93_011423, partial [Exophiala xenobiotica]
MPEVVGHYKNKPDSITYIKDWDRSANDWIPMTEDEFRKVDELKIPGARCPNIPPVHNVEELLPSLEAVAKRPYAGGLWPAWDLKRGERLLVKMSNWHHPLVVEAVRIILKKFGTDFSVEIEDKGPIPNWQGHDEAEYYLDRTKELAQWIDSWE